MRVCYPRLASRLPLLTACWLVAACGNGGDKGITSPNGPKPCGSGGTVTLTKLSAVTLACSSGTTVTLAGGGASYLVVPQYATGIAVNRPTAYTLALASSGASSNLVSVATPTLSIIPNGPPRIPTSIGRGSRQRAFDAMLMDNARRNVLSGAWRPLQPNLAPATAPARVTVPPVGTISKFHVLSSESPIEFTAVGARLSYVGTNILIYVDTAAPPNGFTSDQLNAFGQLFDQTLYPIDTAAFGQPSDIDQNGHLIVLLSPIVNALTPAAQCKTQGFIGGFFDGIDLASSDTSSNHGEIFYSLVPDPNGQVSCVHTVSDLLADTPPTFLHELQHLINFSQHVVAHHGQPELGWLDEGLSRVAEELGSLYYEDKYPPPSGRKDPAQLFPDSSEGYIFGVMVDSYEYLLKPDTATLTTHSDADGGLAWRGGDWLLMRWLGDVKGTSIYKALEQSSLTGTANIANAAGESFDQLFGDFSLTPYTDSIPGIPKSAIPVRNRFARRNLRQMYDRLYKTSSGSSLVPLDFPITLTPLTGSISASMVPGTMSFYQLTTPTGQGTVTIDFGATPGVPLTAALHPQLSIFRLQ